MGDLINRQAAIDEMDNIANFVNFEDEDYILQAEAIDNLKALPSIQQWTPVQQNPERSGWYIVTKRFGNGETWIGAKWYSTAYGWTGDGVLAWMELPEAYKEGE